LTICFEKEQFKCVVSNVVSYEDLLTMALSKCNINTTVAVPYAIWVEYLNGGVA
jgi:hypothetical protein